MERLDTGFNEDSGTHLTAFNPFALYFSRISRHISLEHVSHPAQTRHIANYLRHGHPCIMELTSIDEDPFAIDHQAVLIPGDLCGEPITRRE